LAFGLRDVGRAASQPARLASASLRALSSLASWRQSLWRAGRLPLGLAFGIGGHGAGLADALAGGGHLCDGQRALRLLVVVPQLHQQLALLDAVAFLHRQHLDAAAGDRRQLGALAGFDRPGARIGDRRFDQATFDLPEHHGDRFRSRRPPHAPGDQNGVASAVAQGQSFGSGATTVNISAAAPRMSSSP
jgi:hypothetical protein